MVKVTKKREKCKRKARFSFHFRFFSDAVGCGLVEREILDVVDFRFAAIRSSYDGDGIQSNVVS